jgi:hypothetical protein
MARISQQVQVQQLQLHQLPWVTLSCTIAGVQQAQQRLLLPLLLLLLLLPMGSCLGLGGLLLPEQQGGLALAC